MASLLTQASRSVMPWKNGGGSTTEIYVFPPGADLASFDWRISLASIAASGPFSSFPDIDRSLSLVSGAGVDLYIDDAAEQGEKSLAVALRLGQTDTVQFRGEAKVDAQIVDGETLDFNVMTRRTRCRHQFMRLSLSGTQTWQAWTKQTLNEQTAGGQSLIFAAHGSVCLTSADNSAQQWQLQTGDSLLLDSSDAQEWQLQSDAATLFLVQISAL